MRSVVAETTSATQRTLILSLSKDGAVAYQILTAAGESNPIALPLHLGKGPRLQRGMEAAAVHSV